MNPNIAAFHSLSSEAGLTLWVVETHRSDPCDASEGEAVTLEGPDALIDFLKGVPELEVVELDEVDLDSHPARVVDVTAVEGTEGVAVT